MSVARSWKWNVNSGWCAAVNNNSTASGAPIIQYVCNDPDAHDIFTW